MTVEREDRCGSSAGVINAILLAATMLLCGVFTSAYLGLSFNGTCKCGPNCPCKIENHSHEIKPDRERIKPGPTP